MHNESISLFAASDMYEILGIFCVRTEPIITEALKNGSITQDISIVLKEVGLDAAHVDKLVAPIAPDRLMDNPDAFFHCVRREYTRLFSSPKFSVTTLLEGQFMGLEKREKTDTTYELNSAAADAKRFYRAIGFESAITPRLREDHLAVELELMQTLCRNQALADERGDEEPRNALEENSRRFFETHLATWAFSLFDLVSESASEPVYKQFGLIGRAFLEHEAQRLG